MSQAERRQLLLQVDAHMTLRRDGDDLVLTVSPGFAEPIERVFMIRLRTPVSERRPDAKLTPRQMALLCCWQDGQSLKAIARNWDVNLGTVRGMALTIRKALRVADLDQAVDLVQDRLAKCRDTLPLSRRCQKRPPAEGSPLSESLLAVLRLMADGRGCVEIAKTLGKDKSTISRQMKQVCVRLGVEDQQAAVQRANEMGLTR